MKNGFPEPVVIVKGREDTLTPPKEVALEEQDHVWFNRDSNWYCAAKKDSDTAVYCQTAEHSRRYAIALFESRPVQLIAEGEHGSNICLRMANEKWKCSKQQKSHSSRRVFESHQDSAVHYIISGECKHDAKKELTCTRYNQTSTLSNVTQVINDGRTLCAITALKDVYCLGLNDTELVAPQTTDSDFIKEFTKIEGLKDIVDISFGYDHACAIDTNKELWCWGNNDVGQLGEPSPFIRTVQFPQ